MKKPGSYLLCGTPRTGSTLLCGLLGSTGVAGRPESYFREPDLSLWAGRFGVPVAHDGSFDYRALVPAAVRAARTQNGVFAARIMWGTLHLVVDGLKPCPGTQSDLDILVDAFGPLTLVHLRREDVVSQAVSWARAEQTDYWQQNDLPTADPHLDLGQIDDLVRTVNDHNAAWNKWFTGQGVQPYVVTYEDLIANPRRTVQGILDVLGVEPPSGWRPESPHRKQADEVNADWIRRYKNWRG